MQRSEFRHFIELPVHWGDQDALGHVNNVQFFRYLESARVAYVEAVFGLPVRADGEGVILADLQCAFRSQLEYPVTVEVGTRIARLGRSSFDVHAAIWRQGAEAPAATSRGVIVWFDFRAQKPAPLPDSLRERVRAWETLKPNE